MEGTDQTRSEQLTSSQAHEIHNKNTREAFLVNLQDKQTPITVVDTLKTIKHWFYKDEFYTAEETLTHFTEMLQLGKVINENEDKLDKDDELVKKFYEAEEVVNILADREMFNYFFHQIEESNTWTDAYNEPTRRVRYKFEENMSLVSCLCEATINAPVLDVLSLFCEIDMFQDWFPNVK